MLLQSQRNACPDFLFGGKLHEHHVVKSMVCTSELTCSHPSLASQQALTDKKDTKDRGAEQMSGLLQEKLFFHFSEARDHQATSRDHHQQPRRVKRDKFCA